MEFIYMSKTSDKEAAEAVKIMKKAVDKDVVKHGGYRPGSGRPRGSKNKKTKSLSKRVLSQDERMKKRIMKNTDSIINAQLNLARGVSYLFKIKFKTVGGRRTPIHELVEDPEEIKAYLDGELEDEFYYITTDKPETRAANSLLDRAYGKAGGNKNDGDNFSVTIINYDNKQIEDGRIREAEVIEGDSDSIPIRAEELSAGVSSSETKIQDSSMA